MASVFAPPDMLAAFSCAADGTDLRKGAHLRVFPLQGRHFPLAPLVVFRVKADPQRYGGDAIDLSRLGSTELIPALGDDDTWRTVRLDVETGSPDRLESATLFDPFGRTVVHRHVRPWRFSAPAMHGLRLRGNAEDVTLQVVRVSREYVLHSATTPAAYLSLPIEGSQRWYACGLGRTAAIERVLEGAPPRLDCTDRPNGPFDLLGPADEVQRVEALLADSKLRGGLDGGLEPSLLKLVADADAPWTQRTRRVLTDAGAVRQQSVHLPRLAALQFATLDPGLGRFFGTSAVIGDLPDDDDWNVLAVAGLFARPMSALERLGHRITAPDPAVIDVVIRALEQRVGAGARQEVEACVTRTRAAGLAVQAVIAVTAPTAPWDPPALPPPDVLDVRWHPAEDGMPSATFRAGYAFKSRTATTLAAVSARLQQQWTPRHDVVAVPGPAITKRAKPRILGQALPSAELVRNQGGGVIEPMTLLSDQELPADEGGIRVRVQASDLFGRFGAPVEFTVSPPPRPLPPSPHLEFKYVSRKGIAPTSREDESPGELRVELDRSRVPLLDELAAGSLPITRLKLTLQGPHDPPPPYDPLHPDPPPPSGPVATESIDLTALEPVAATFTLGGLAPQRQAAWTLTGIYEDSAGNESAASVHTVLVADTRAPEPYPTGVGLFWSSAPGTGPEAELQLTWQAQRHSKHRVYLADAIGLGLDSNVLDGPAGGPPLSRGAVAAMGCDHVRDGAPVPRDRFRLLTDPPLTADDNGTVRLDTVLPRSLSSVQFLRIVPLGPDGAEPPFDRCGIVPVAVPDDRRCAPPGLSGAIAPASGTARLRIIAADFDLATLQRDEPALFGLGPRGTQAPQFRISRAAGRVPDPIYARTIAEGTLVPGEGQFTVDLEDEVLAPFVTYSYWAQVRPPPERRLPAVLDPEDPEGGVRPVHPAGALDHPRPYSKVSAPRVLKYVPPSVPAAPEQVTLALQGDSEVSVEIPSPPRAHALACGRYRLAAWAQWSVDDRPVSDLTPAQRANGADLAGQWPGIEEGTVTLGFDRPPGLANDAVLSLHLAYVDPCDRVGDIERFTTP